MKKKLVSAVTVAAAATLSAGLAQAEPASFHWQKDEGQSLALMNGSAVVWRCVFGPGNPKPCFHPAALTDGTILTEDKPADHTWHRAIWFSWKYINGVNYWEYKGRTQESEGKTEWSNVSVEARPDFSAGIAMDLAYRDPKGAIVMTEQRRVELSAPDASGLYRMDWTGVFKAGEQAVKLDRTPLPGEPGGQIWGGYSGLSIRLANRIRDREVISNEGPLTFNKDGRYRGKHGAMDYSGIFDGRTAGIAVLDHPGNPGSPTPWYVIQADMSFFSPAVICYGPKTLKPGETFTLRYRILIHKDRWTSDQLRKALEEYRGSATGR